MAAMRIGGSPSSDGAEAVQSLLRLAACVAPSSLSPPRRRSYCCYLDGPRRHLEPVHLPQQLAVVAGVRFFLALLALSSAFASHSPLPPSHLVALYQLRRQVFLTRLPTAILFLQGYYSRASSFDYHGCRQDGDGITPPRCPSLPIEVWNMIGEHVC